MQTWMWPLCWFLLSTTSVGSESESRPQYRDRRTDRAACGSSLANTLRWLCGERGYYVAMENGYSCTGRGWKGKRDTRNARKDLEIEDATGPFLAKTHAHTFLAKRTRSGIVEECCHRGCGIGELESYCCPRTLVIKRGRAGEHKFVTDPNAVMPLSDNIAEDSRKYLYLKDTVFPSTAKTVPKTFAPKAEVTANVGRDRVEAIMSLIRRLQHQIIDKMKDDITDG